MTTGTTIIRKKFQSTSEALASWELQREQELELNKTIVSLHPHKALLKQI